VVIDDGEPIDTVPEAIEQEGHEILSRRKDGKHWRLQVRAA
jgi:sulfite reductase (ferredoxin)